MTAPANTPKGPSDKPLEVFSNCHEGILAHLAEFGQLPALLEPAAEARKIASQTLTFFRAVVYEHHAEEESELFPAVAGGAAQGEERLQVQAIVKRLTQEHRQIEAAWSKLEPALKEAAKGHDSTLDAAAVAALVATYKAHAAYEEETFLPLSQTILGRNSAQMGALGLSMHLRHAVPELMKRLGHRI